MSNPEVFITMGRRLSPPKLEVPGDSSWGKPLPPKVAPLVWFFVFVFVFFLVFCNKCVSVPVPLKKKKKKVAPLKSHYEHQIHQINTAKALKLKLPLES